VRACVLGSAAGGGFPQWNCACPNCHDLREGRPGLHARTQDSVAVSAGGGDRWALLNASPDVLTQMARYRPLHPRGPRASPLAAVVLTNGDLDHCLGLFCLRESTPLAVYATAAVLRGLVDRNAICRTLARFEGHVVFRALELGRPEALLDAAGEPLGLELVARPVPGKPPLHLAGDQPSAEDNVGLWARDEGAGPGETLAYVPGAGALGDYVAHLEGAGCVLFDGTFWADDELVRLGLGRARAREMAHLPVGGPGGSLEALASLPARRKLYTHVNNTNPALREGSDERRAVERAGWALAEDGQEVFL
jgi:pyrroloquinoline quinone biosynthesis protein B